MTTKRESFIQALVLALKAVPDFPAAIVRSIDGAFSREEGSILVVHRGGETAEMQMDFGAARECEIRLSTVTRGDNPEGDSDLIFEAAYPVISGFKADGLMSVEEIGTIEPKHASPGSTLLITTRFLFRYNTSAGTLSG